MKHYSGRLTAKSKDLFFWLSRISNHAFMPPEVLQISLTYRCNLRCRMCSIADLLPQEEELSHEQIFRIIDEASLSGIKELVLTGGEPFLRQDIFNICDYAASKGLKSVVTTNGVLIDSDMAGRIAQSGLNHVHISLDGLEPTNDFYRGRGAFTRTIQAIKSLNKARDSARRFSIGIAVTVMDKNAEELYEIVKLCDGLNIDTINFQPLISNNANFMERVRPEDWVSRVKIPLLEDQINKIRDSSWKHIRVFEEPRPELLVKYYKGELTKRDWVCFGGFKTVFICFSKNEPLVYTCHGICGNLNKEPLKKAWASKEAQKLRVHSRECRDLCLQSCYSRESSSSLKSILGMHFFKGKNG